MKFKITIILFIMSSLLFAGLIFFNINQVLAPMRDNEERILKHHLADPFDEEFYDTVYSFIKDDFDFHERIPFAGIVPHHLLAGDMIADFYHNLSKFDYDTIVLLGPNHFDTGVAKLISSDKLWQTPFGKLEIDKELLRALKKTYPSLGIESKAMQGEHSISSQVGFIKKTFPNALFLPLILRSNLSQSEADALADAINIAQGDRHVLLLASADFSHYVDSVSASKHDQESIRVINAMDFDDVYKIEVDSPPTIYAVMKYSDINSAGFKLLDNSNSALLVAKPEIEETTSYITGYFVEQKIRMLFFGDLMLDRYVGDRIKEKGIDYFFSKLKEDNFFSAYDLISANLEGAVTDDGEHYAPVKAYDFAFHPELIADLKKYNFNFFNLANNHVEDQGIQGINETRENLKKLGFYYSGDVTGRVSQHSSQIIEIENKQIAMIGLSDLWSTLNKEDVWRLVDGLASSSNLVVVNIHWGEEYKTKISIRQKEMAHFLIDAGADIIIGHHPHVVQEFEEYKNKLIFYSLGNFIFDQYFSEETQKGLAIEIIYNGKDVEYKLHPFFSRFNQLELDLS